MRVAEKKNFFLRASTWPPLKENLNKQMKETEEEALLSQPDVKPSVRPATIAKADCILSHPGGLLGKVFNQ